MILMQELKRAEQAGVDSQTPKVHKYKEEVVQIPRDLDPSPRQTFSKFLHQLVGDDYVFEKDSLTDNNASDSEEENAPKRRGRGPLSLQALNRRRVIWLNQDAVTKARRERIAAEVAQKALAAQKAAAAAKRKRQAEQERHEREERKKHVWKPVLPRRASRKHRAPTPPASLQRVQ